MTQMTQMTQVNSGQGNTNNCPDFSKRGRKWCFTLNNWTEEKYDSITQYIIEASKYYIVGKEVGASGTPHLQGYIEFKSQRSFSSIQKKLMGSHIEIAKGNAKSNFEYCSKDGDYITNMVDYKPKEKIIDPLDGLTLHTYQKDILELIKTGDDDRSIRWYYENNGNVGKSALCKHICINYDALILSGKQNDMYNAILLYNEKKGHYPKTIIIDIPRSQKDYISYGGIESIKNGCFYSGKYEGGMVVMNCPTVIVMANQEPDYDTMSMDRWKVVNVSI